MNKGSIKIKAFIKKMKMKRVKSLSEANTSAPKPANTSSSFIEFINLDDFRGGDLNELVSPESSHKIKWRGSIYVPSQESTARRGRPP